MKCPARALQAASSKPKLMSWATLRRILSAVSPHATARFSLERGHAYVYFVYGNHFMLNVSGEREGVGEGVLLRAAEPLEGIERMKRYRHTRRAIDLARGPGRLAEAFRITRQLDGVDLCGSGKLWLGTAVRPAGRIGVSARIGITKEAHRPLRFFERGNPFVSGPKSLQEGLHGQRKGATDEHR